MNALMPKILEADVLVFASPVYMYSISAQLKAVFDRMVAKYETIRDKELYYILTAAEDEEHTMDTAIACMRRMADCIPGSKEMGMIWRQGCISERRSPRHSLYATGLQDGEECLNVWKK